MGTTVGHIKTKKEHFIINTVPVTIRVHSNILVHTRRPFFIDILLKKNSQKRNNKKKVATKRNETKNSREFD